MERTGGYSGLALGTWARPRAAMRTLLAIRPREAVVLGFAMVGMLFVFIARVPVALRAAQEAGVSPEGMVAAQFVSLVLFAPLFLYGVAALIRTGFRLTGGSGGWYETRLALFWTLMVTAPLHGIATAMQQLPAGVLAAAAALWILSGCLAEGHGVAQWRAALVAAVSVGLLLGLGWLLATVQA